MTNKERSVEEIRQRILDEMNAGRKDGKTYINAEWLLDQYDEAERQKREEMVKTRDRQLSYWLKHDIQCAVEFEAGDCDCGLKEALTQPNNPK